MSEKVKKEEDEVERPYWDRLEETETPAEDKPEENVKSVESTSTVESVSEIGIEELIEKRGKLEEAIDYVGLMIKNLKDKRTLLEKDIEEESVDIKNLKEKLQKVSE